MKSLKINTQIILIGFITLIGFMIVGGLYWNSNQIQDHLRYEQEKNAQRLNLITQINYEVLKSRQEEKDFLSSKDLSYMARYNQTFITISEQVKELESMIEKTENHQALKQLESRLNDFRAQFSKVAERTQTIGLTEKDGLRGSLRQAVHDVETLLKEAHEDGLTVLMLMMRRHEKDFLLRDQAKYMDRMDQRKAEFQIALKNSFMSPEKQALVTQLMEAYHRDFKALAENRLAQLEEITVLEQRFEDVVPQLTYLWNAFETDYEDSRQAAVIQSRKNFMLVSVIMGAIAVLVISLALWVGRSIGGPVLALSGVMHRLAEDDLEVDIPILKRTNEIGEMAAAVQKFHQNALHLRALEAQQNENQARAEVERRQMVENLASSFEQSVFGVVEQVGTASSLVRQNVGHMSQSAGNTLEKSNHIEHSASLTNENVQSVASAAEQLNLSIREISTQIHDAARMSTAAISKVDGTRGQITQLVGTVNSVTDVLELIRDIADQTNLLALNATIEAARAGEAGKGFAVVASEVKELANQTAKATDEIVQKITEIQSVTDITVASIGEITDVIQDIDGISGQISSSINQQEAATQEIARSVDVAANSTQEVSANIEGIRQAADLTSRNSNDVMTAVGDLSVQADHLRERVEQFVQHLRKG